MWHLDKIPQHAHFYWATSMLPWIRYMSLQTFRYHNPNWKITLWKPPALTVVSDYDKSIKNWWSEVGKLNIEIADLDIPKLVGIDYSYHPNKLMRDVHYSDFAYMYLLHHHGGVWANMDILFFKSMENGIFNRPGYLTREVIGLEKGFNNLMLAHPKSEVMQSLLTIALNVSKKSILNNFAATGPSIWEKFHSTKVLRLPATVTEPRCMETRYYRKGEMFEMPGETIGIHWHGAGTHGTHAHLSLENYVTEKSLIAQIVTYALGLQKKESTPNFPKPPPIVVKSDALKK